MRGADATAPGAAFMSCQTPSTSHAAWVRIHTTVAVSSYVSWLEMAASKETLVILSSAAMTVRVRLASNSTIFPVSEEPTSWMK